MGYYGTFTFDLTIPSKHLVAAQKSLVDNDLIVVNEDRLDEALGEWLDAVTPFYKEVSPLEQLARVKDGGEARGDLCIQGTTHQKWSDDMDMIPAYLGPYLTRDSTVHIRGEEGEQGFYRFETGQLVEDWGVMLFGWEKKALEGAENALR
jgi:hypothetical protein